MKKRKLSLTAQIALGLGLGVVVGLVLQPYPGFATDYIRPIGTIYLNLITTIVVPVVVLSIVQGVVSLQDIKKVGTIGLGTVLFYLCTTALAVVVGLVLANLLEVGAGFQLPAEQLNFESQDAPPFMQTVVNIFPSNFLAPMVEGAMLPTIVIALLIGFGIILAGEKGHLLSRAVDSAAEVAFRMMALILSLSGIGVFALICPVIAENGVQVLVPLLKVILVAYVCYAIHMTVVYSASVGFIARVSPLTFFKAMFRPGLVAFSSASSVVALPFTLEAVESLGAKKEITGFVIPLGTTINMDGTAIYQGICAVFIAQIFGVTLDFMQQLTVVLTATLASIGAAGVPGAGMIMLAMVLQSVGLPVEGIALVAGIDRILDMGRTVVNITGDAACALCISARHSRPK
jgi:Na+/H+-dicarboxylate symporter